MYIDLLENEIKELLEKSLFNKSLDGKIMVKQINFTLIK